MRTATEATNNGAKRRTSRTVARIENTIAALPDLAAQPVVAGSVGAIRFDDGHTMQCSRCYAEGSDEDSLAVVDIDIYPAGNADVTVRFEHFFASDTRTTIELSAKQLEPLAIALSRAVANAKARGYLPDPAEGAAT